MIMGKQFVTFRIIIFSIGQTTDPLNLISIIVQDQ